MWYRSLESAVCRCFSSHSRLIRVFYGVFKREATLPQRWRGAVRKVVSRHFLLMMAYLEIAIALKFALTRTLRKLKLSPQAEPWLYAIGRAVF